MKKQAKNKYDAELMADIKEVQHKLDCAWSFYNRVSDDALISAGIYEITSLQAQYSHLLICAKQALQKQSVAV